MTRYGIAPCAAPVASAANTAPAVPIMMIDPSASLTCSADALTPCSATGDSSSTSTLSEVRPSPMPSPATTLAGASLTGAALTWSLGAWLQGRPGLRTPRGVLLTLGFVLVLIGIGLVAVATSDTVPAVTAAIGWVVAGLGMGLGLTSLSVLVLELSPVAEQGVNASALQVSDALGSIIMIGTAAITASMTR